MKTIYFVRHGESQANIDKIYAGSRIDSPLTTKGFEQADRTAEILEGKRFDLIVSSPLRRARDTAMHIAKKVGYKDALLLEPLLAERDFGRASGRAWTDVDADIESGSIEELETIPELAARMQKLLAWFRTLPGKHIIAVGHGTAERMLQTIVMGKPAQDFWATKELANTEVRTYLLD